MPYQIKGTRFSAADLNTAVAFEIALDREELKALRSRHSDEELAVIREQAAELVRRSGLFKSHEKEEA